jgi:hypothetical protein
MTPEEVGRLIEGFCEATGAGYGWQISGASFGTRGGAQKAMCEWIAAEVNRRLAEEREACASAAEALAVAPEVDLDDDWNGALREAARAIRAR